MRESQMVNSTFGFDTPEESPGFLLWQTTIIWQRRIKNALESYGISHSQFVIMALLLWCEETNLEPIQSFIVNKTKLDKMTVSKALKKLVTEEMVKRNEHSHDTRAKLVCLTKKGKTLIKKIVPIVEGVDQKFFDVINKENQKTLINFLRRLASG